MLPFRLYDLQRYALWAGYNAADARHLPRLHAVITTRVMTLAEPLATLVAQAQWADKLTDHHAAAIVRFDTERAAKVVSHLGGHWPEFVGAEFAPMTAPLPPESL